MFDRTYVTTGGGSHHHTNTSTVYEHKAPTDQSIAILNEMQEKTITNLLANYTVWNNTFIYNIHLLCKEGLEFYRVCYCLNGQPQHFDIQPRDMKRDGDLYDEVHRVLRKKISRQLESTMLKWFDLKRLPNVIGDSLSFGYKEPTSFHTASDPQGRSSEELGLEWIKELVKSRFQQDKNFRNFIEDLVE